jgi:D-alanyl-D-alanine carboxypeptidase (penicillin-binding protein 5/6)
MLIASANNYAESLAVWAYGSNEAFLEAANVYLQKNGLTNTTIADPAGFSPDSASTLKDLVRISEIALSNRTVAEIVAKPSVTVENIGTFYTTNQLVRQNEAIGIKTGNTDEAGQCLLFAQSYPIADETVTIYGAILGGTERTAVARDANTLLDTTAQQFTPIIYTQPDEVYAVYTTPWGSSGNLISKTTAGAVVWQGNEHRTKISAPSVNVGDVSVQGAKATLTSGPITASQVLVLSNPIEGPSFLWRITHPLKVLGV